MTLRHAVLPIGAVLVLGLGLYLFIEVRADPAPVMPSGDHAARDAPSMAPPAATALQDSVGTAKLTPARSAPGAGEPGLAHDVTSGGSVDPDAPLVGPKLDAAMDEANRAYDHGEYDDAKQAATRILTKLPTNVRMLRIMVSASCIDGDAPVAQAAYQKLPPGDQDQMKVRCARYGITFPDRP